MPGSRLYSSVSSTSILPLSPSIAAPRAVELTVIEDDFCLPLAFFAAYLVSGLHLVQPGSLVQRSWQVAIAISCCMSVNL